MSAVWITTDEVAERAKRSAKVGEPFTVIEHLTPSEYRKLVQEQLIRVLGRMFKQDVDSGKIDGIRFLRENAEGIAEYELM